MITLEKAKKALEAAERKAKELGVVISIVIVDEHGVEVAACRMDGALIISHEFAHQKAYTSAVLRFSTSDLAKYAGEGKPYFGVANALGGKFTIVGGGIPVTTQEKVVGGVGVGGSTDINQDITCAQEAVKILQS